MYLCVKSVFIFILKGGGTDPIRPAPVVPEKKALARG